MRSAPDGSCATRCHVVPPSASYGRLMPRGCRLLPRFWRRFQRPPRVGLNPARGDGVDLDLAGAFCVVRDLYEALNAAAGSRNP